MATEEDSHGCVNQAFDAAGDGFQTIDLRKTKNEEQEQTEFQQNTEEAPQVVHGKASHVTETRCGWSTFRPVCLQKFRTAKWALFWLCWAGAIQGMVVNGFVNVVITTIERRFGLRSMQTGIIAGGYDMASFICLAPVTYLGGRAQASKPRWIGWGVLLMGIGSLVFALPHFLVPPYRKAVLEEDDLCIANRTLIPECVDSNMGEGNWAVIVFLCAQLLHGAGATPLFTLGVTYIDENVSKKMSSVYLGIYYTMAVIGPALGYVLGGQMLNIYTDFATVDPETIGITPSSSIWIGAWWVGFIVSAFICFFVALPLLAFPYELPGAEEIRASKVSEAHEGAASKSAAFSALKELPSAAAALLRNPTFMFLNLAGASEGMLISGFAAFMPKLIENQFAVSAAEAALLLGVITVPAGGGGTFLGGWLVKRWKLPCAGIIKLCVAATVLSALFTFCFVLTCPDYAFAGITVPYKDSQLTSAGPDRLSSSCNSECSCGWQYSPVCGADGVVYYSSCHAGCQSRTIYQGNTLYADCSCIISNYTLPSYEFGAVLASTQHNASVNYSAVNSVCPSECPYLWVFVTLAFGIMLFTFIATMPALSATLRCVREDQRSFALGIQWIKVRLLGTIPAPLIFGFLIDLSCSFWKKECDVTGACLLYDNVNMSRYMLALAFVGKLCSLLFFFLAWWLYKAPGSNKTSVPAVDKANGIANGYCNPGLDCTEHL